APYDVHSIIRRSLDELRSDDVSYLVLSLFFVLEPSDAMHPLALHDALPISWCRPANCLAMPIIPSGADRPSWGKFDRDRHLKEGDRKSTRLNSSHVSISYAVFCLKKTIRRSSNARSSKKEDASR